MKKKAEARREDLRKDKKGVKMKEYRYWFSDDTGKNVGNDFIGTYEEAESYAQEIADKIYKDIYINCNEDIVGMVFCNDDIY